MHRSPGLRVAVALVCWLGLLTPADAKMAPTPSFGHAAIVQRDGEPTLVLDGKPVFFWGAAFFYERLPPAAWRGSMLELRALGATTLDLYVPWNWHEVADGEFDFDGHTNPRRNLREVLRLGRALGFTFIVRPGPVIRNEWRNGGYPAWLLTRPEYGMPLHDVLEGRYPATATLQNARSDDAAAEWMRNATHMRYASRWLHRALAEFRPVADRVIAVQLDDDQGAYVDNQTFPAPHLQRYLRWLDAQVRDVVGPITPTFINTYEMRVPASAPVWTMGNWYQSDVYAIGEHDRVALDLATAMLRTNRRGPLAMSEFQAGWLAQPEDPQPRPADPSNTTLALYELLGWGVHGVVDFPMQDTLAPFGWEAPFSNALYAWDAALRYPDVAAMSLRSDRYGPTWSFGQMVRTIGPLLAEAHRVADVGLAYSGSAYPGDAASGMTALGRFRDDVRTCVRRGTPCDVVDLAYASPRTLRRFRSLVVDDGPTRRAHAALLAAFERGGGRVVTRIPAERVPGSILRGADGTFLVAVNWSAADRRDPAAQVTVGGVTVDVPPFETPARSGRLVALDVRVARLDARYPAGLRITTSCTLGRDRAGVFVSAFPSSCEVSLRGAMRSVAAGIPFAARASIRFDGTLELARRPCCERTAFMVESSDDVAALSPHDRAPLMGIHPNPSAVSETYRADVFADGAREVILQNRVARAIVVPEGGARIPVFTLLPSDDRADSKRSPPENAFDATGALRDDALLQPPPSTTDRIARYTRSYPAGTFNRTYAVSDAHDGSVHLVADVPDVVPGGAHFERIVSLQPGTARLAVDERVLFGAGPNCENQRGVVLSALAVDPDARGEPRRSLVVDAVPVTVAGTLDAPHGVALIENAGTARFVLAVSWRPGDVESASWQPQRSNGTLRLVLAPGWRRVTYALSRVDTPADARAFVEAERAWVAANPAPSSEDGEVAKRYTQSPQKRPSESSCGFESHLPQ
jgi:hypothetical protein